MAILFQLLLAIFGAELGSALITKLGGPRLVIGKPSIHDEVLLPRQSQSFSTRGHDYMPSGGTISPSLKSELINEYQPYADISKRHYIHIPILNEQKSRLEISMAKRVYAKLAFYDLDKKPIGKGIEFNGRWARSRQPSAFENTEELRFIDIGPGDNQSLDIAVRDIATGYWYVWNNDNYNSNDPDKRLQVDGFIFSLKLNGANCAAKPICYKFTSAGSNFSKVEEPAT